MPQPQSCSLFIRLRCGIRSRFHILSALLVCTSGQRFTAREEHSTVDQSLQQFYRGVRVFPSRDSIKHNSGEDHTEDKEQILSQVAAVFIHQLPVPRPCLLFTNRECELSPASCSLFLQELSLFPHPRSHVNGSGV